MEVRHVEGLSHSEDPGMGSFPKSDQEQTPFLCVRCGSLF